MLRVPEAKTGPRPVDPDLQSLIAPPREPSSPRHSRDQDQTSAAAMEVLDLALVKSAITRLHQEEERHFQTLQQYTESRIANLVDDHRAFLKNQKNACDQALADNHRKELFEFMTRAYFRRSIDRAEELQRRKIHEFHVEAIGAQNREFLNRALLPENSLDDEAQTAYRNMILLNLENLYQDAPKEERDAVLNDAAATFYKKIIEKRLETAPETTAVLLDADSVEKALGGETIREYRRQAGALEKNRTVRRRAASYVDEGLTFEQAKEKAGNASSEDREGLLRHYKELRCCDSRKLYLTRILNMETVWRDLMRNEGDRACLPAWVRNTDPALYEAVLENLSLRERHGGLPPDPDYALLLEFAAEFDPYAVAERFRDEKELYRVVTGLGGPDAPAFQAVLRMLLGKATPKDRAWLEDLSRAGAAMAERMDGREAQEWLRRFDAERGILLERGSHDRLTERETAGILAMLGAV